MAPLYVSKQMEIRSPRAFVRRPVMVELSAQRIHRVPRTQVVEVYAPSTAARAAMATSALHATANHRTISA